MPADERIHELTASWWRKALEDLTVAGRAADIPFACCFHCQQAVEKAVKALLVLHQIDFRKLHDIGQLLALLQESPTVPSSSLPDGIESLTRYAVDTRYPPGEASQEQAEEALRIAEAFLEWVQGRLPPEAHPEGQ